MRKTFRFFFAILAVAYALFCTCACNKFLDVVPNDGIATVEMSFNMRSSALKYLATCYSYMPRDGQLAGDSNTIIYNGDPAILGGDEVWDLVGRVVTNTRARVHQGYFSIARGLMSPTALFANDWDAMYQGIRCCDILCENIDRVPDMDQWEKNQWKAEVTFLKAYYHFNLMRKWGPIPIIRESLPIDSSVEQVRVSRNDIDECFDFVIELLDKALPNLPMNVTSNDELGRITQVICSAFKAKVCTYAASPLFNGNPEEATLANKDGKRLFPQKSDAEKLVRWEAALKACEDAIALCDKANIKLFDGKVVTDQYRMTDSLKTELTLRGAFNERWNSEIIWANTQSSSSLMRIFQQLCIPNFSTYQQMLGAYMFLGVPYKIAEQFYTRNGLPINNDHEWDGVLPLGLRKVTPEYGYYLENDYVTANINFNREPRFYAFLGFDGGRWLGQLSNYNDLQHDDVHALECRYNKAHGKTGSEKGPVTGYFPKKLFPYQCTFTAANSFSGHWFAWPIIRLTDLYLLYAECANEVEGPDGPHSAKLFEYMDAIRTRAGIPGVKDAWDNYSNNPGYYGTKVGMREIIRRERLNELAFESQRFWDLRRWMTAPAEYAKGIYGMSVMSSEPEDYYVKTFIEEQHFGLKDYFWPMQLSNLETNPNLVQNLGW